MNIAESIRWLNSYSRFGIKLGLERIKNLLELMDNPQNYFRVIHVGGTNGKGSVCHFISSILFQNGYNVGLYTSPHIQEINERIVVNKKKISNKELSNLAKKIKPLVEQIENIDPPTYFEILTAMAFQYFKDKKIDFAVIEVGLGGRYDATNIVTPSVSIITNVTYDHKEILGKRIGKIAYEKSGIIKNNTPVVTAALGEALRIIENVAKENNSIVHRISKKNIKRICSNDTCQDFVIKGTLKQYFVKTKMLGEHQGQNIAVALGAVELLQMNGVFISDSGILEGIEKASIPGRTEIVRKSPMVLLDGAHNPAGIKTLKHTLENDFFYKRIILVLGILADKDIDKMLSTIVPLANIVILAKPKNDRAWSINQIRKKLEKMGFFTEIIEINDVKNAVTHALSIAEDQDIICVTGSLYTVGEARDFFTNK
ncbi:MAG: bifunctional folylpolyglutamate synthase/dihydrofolate synthase [Candidatus Thermoplasmatota archaeon]|nr:bifunctional folylpolyglutamate synthase/dihydrofolate synthase [Candidatus Thermoplasmatota archaeon]